MKFLLSLLLGSVLVGLVPDSASAACTVTVGSETAVDLDCVVISDGDLVSVAFSVGRTFAVDLSDAAVYQTGLRDGKRFYHKTIFIGF